MIPEWKRKPREPYGTRGFGNTLELSGIPDGGEEEDRTPDLRIANATLSQLSYPPNDEKILAQGFSKLSSGPRRQKPHLEGAPANTQSTTIRISASLIAGCEGIGIAPQTPDPPSFTLRASFTGA